MYLLILFLLGVLTFASYIVVIVSVALGAWNNNPQKIRYGLKALVWAIVFTIIFGLVLNAAIKDLFNNTFHFSV